MTVAILVYHRLPEGQPTRFHDVTRRDFLAHLALLSDRGAQGPGPVLRIADGTAVLISFDDGTRDHLLAAAQLEEHGWRGLFFVSPALLGSEGRMAPSDVAALSARGHWIDAHGFSHRRLDRMERHDAMRELTQAQRRMVEICGHPAQWFAPPGGSDPPGFSQMLAQSGFAVLRSMNWGRAREPLAGIVPAIPVTSRIGAHGLARLLDRSHVAWLVARAAKRIVRSGLGDGIADRICEAFTAVRRRGDK